MNKYTFRGSNSVVFIFASFVSGVQFSKKRISLLLWELIFSLNPIALGKAKIVYNFGLSECNRIKSRPSYRKALSSREENRKSQKLFPFAKMTENHEVYPFTLT